MALIRTVTGDVDAQLIRGAVGAFAHLAPDWRPISDRDPDFELPSEARLAAASDAGKHTVEVVASIGGAGIGLIVDATPPGAGRDPMRLHKTSAATGMAIIACTGAHAPPARLARVDDRSAEYLAEWFAFEIGSGMAAVAGDCFRGVPLLSDRGVGVAGDALNDAAIRAGAIRISLASPAIDRADGALIDACAMTAAATGVATFVVAPSSTDLNAVATRFEASGGNRSRLALDADTRRPEAILAAAALGLTVVVTAPAIRTEGAVAIWEGTLRALIRHGLLGQAVATIPIPLIRARTAQRNDVDTPYRVASGIEDSELHKVTRANAIRLLAITL
jgi:predicted metal-dependent phosphotriesterase family hydrolase